MNASGQQFTTIDEYIDSFPAPARDRLRELKEAIKEEAPDAEETFSYSMPAFRDHGILVYFAAFKNHIGFFPTASPIEHFADRLTGYKTSKGTIQLPMDRPLPLDLIREIVRFRVQENLAKRASGRSRS